VILGILLGIVAAIVGAGYLVHSAPPVSGD
jgi:hypothetical protein